MVHKGIRPTSTFKQTEMNTKICFGIAKHFDDYNWCYMLRSVGVKTNTNLVFGGVLPF